MTDADAAQGEGAIRASLAGTALFVVTAGSATAFKALAIVPLIIDPLLFVAGLGAFVLTFVRAAPRSRTDEIGLMGLFLLEGATAPSRVKRLLLGAFAVEVAVAFITAALRPNTTVAFGILVPVYGLSITGAWAARHGAFKPRVVHRNRAGGRGAGAE